MDRRAGRALAKTTLEGLNLFYAVWQGAPNKFGGVSPVALITSLSIDLTFEARELYEIANKFTVSLYIKRETGANEVTEDLLDDLALATVVALGTLRVNGCLVFQIDASSAGPDAGNLRDVDGNGVIYRIERIPVTILDENEG